MIGSEEKTWLHSAKALLLVSAAATAVHSPRRGRLPERKEAAIAPIESGLPVLMDNHRLGQRKGLPKVSR